MELNDRRILLTGASGGIGRATALALAGQGARLALLGRDRGKLEEICREAGAQGGSAVPIVADLAREQDFAPLALEAREKLGGLDLLINNAGTLDFTLFANQDPAAIERIFRLNTLAPLQLTRAVIPMLLAQGSGRVVNIGSIFGSVGFACFTAYSASKFALRGFSEALRRELEGSGVGVTYVAPRYTDTPINHGPVSRMAEATKMSADAPETVAARIVQAIRQDVDECYIGGPESLLVRANALSPRLADKALFKQNIAMRRFVEQPS